MRKPVQVLIFQFYKEKNKYLYAIFKRRDFKFWQGISGGLENNETPLKAAKRETFEETKIKPRARFIKLDSKTSIPIENIGKHKWKKDIYIATELSFGVEVETKEIKLSKEHTEMAWVTFKKAIKLLKYDSNKTALWELNRRLTKK